MNKSGTKLVCYYDGKPVYFDKNRKGSIAIAHGQIDPPKNLPGLVYMNNQTGVITNQDGTPYHSEPVEYEVKGYFVGTNDINEATKQIEQTLKIHE